MKNIIIAAVMAMTMTTTWADHHDKKEPETRRVCVDVKDKEGKPVKDAKGNVKQNCKEVRVHKKLEGTKVPEKK